jgi:hypothetical protein
MKVIKTIFSKTSQDARVFLSSGARISHQHGQKVLGKLLARALSQSIIVIERLSLHAENVFNKRIFQPSENVKN